MNNKSCSFFGHRKIDVSENLKKKLMELVEYLIIYHSVGVFLFGSRSEFDALCHSVVTSLKEKYPNIVRVLYTCKSEACILESEREKWERVYSNAQKTPVKLMGFEREVEHKNKYTAGRASYVERNRAMINDSDFCVLYYDENYMPEMRKTSKKSLLYYQPNSGTKLAYEYIRSKKKTFFNLAEN